MSWQAYIDTNLVGSGKVSKAAIIGLDTKQVWAKSADLELSHGELQDLATAFDKLDVVQGSGLRISGTKYFTLTSTEEIIQLKYKVDGACLFKTKKAIILGVYVSPIQQTECSDIVFHLGKYLIEQNY